MPQVDRFSVSLDVELLAAFDRHIASRGYSNRSEAVRDLIRDLLSSQRLPTGNDRVVAVLTAVCRHGEADAGRRLRDSLAEHAEMVAGSIHIPLDSDGDTVVIVLKGETARVHALADGIQAMRGIEHGQVSTIAKSSAG